MEETRKKDLRVIKTEQLIKETFIEMVQTIGYQRITIKDLCEKAMINRNTFYLHYNDKDHLVKMMINEVFTKYNSKIIPMANQFYTNVLLAQKEQFTINVKDFLLLIYEDIEMYRMILLDNDLSGYFKTFETAYEKLILKNVKPKNKRSQLIFRYILSGIGGVLKDWIIKETSSIDDTASIISQLIFENMKFYVESNIFI
jgi:AcrR family transcriptional regulator